jgi:glycerol-3-phosphate dehydrogenase
VLVFPTVDGSVIAGPTAIDQEDKRDWNVSAGAAERLAERARGIEPALERYEPVFSYAGLRPAGAAGVNYVIERSRSCARLVHVAAIRSTGLSASLAIGEHVAAIVGEMGFALRAQQPVPQLDPVEPRTPWWRRSAEYWT